MRRCQPPTLSMHNTPAHSIGQARCQTAPAHQWWAWRTRLRGTTHLSRISVHVLRHTHHMQTVPAKVINEQEEYVRRVGACSQAGHRDEHSQHARGLHHPHRRKFQRRASVVGLRLQRAHTSTRAHTTSHSHGVQPFGAKFSGHALLSITTGMLHRHRATNAVSNAGSCCVMFMAA